MILFSYFGCELHGSCFPCRMGVLPYCFDEPGSPHRRIYLLFRSSKIGVHQAPLLAYSTTQELIPTNHRLRIVEIT
jgi:hypothetical protein